MDTTLTFAPKVISALPYRADHEPPKDTKIPVVKAFDSAGTLPPDRPFVAQVVNARLSGTAFPEKPTEIAPVDRTLRPYNTPMLPSNGAPAAPAPSADSTSPDRAAQMPPQDDANHADLPGQTAAGTQDSSA